MALPPVHWRVPLSIIRRLAPRPARLPMNIIGGREHPLLWVYDNGTESHQNGTLTLASVRIEELSVTRSRSACQPERFRPKLERPLRGKLLRDAVRRGYPYARGRSRPGSLSPTACAHKQRARECSARGLPTQRPL